MMFNLPKWSPSDYAKDSVFMKGKKYALDESWRHLSIFIWLQVGLIFLLPLYTFLKIHQLKRY